MGDRKYHGHKTMADGSHVPLTEEEAKGFWAAVEAARVKRETDMPDAISALSAISTAKQRLRDLGWRDAVYCPKDGSSFAVAESGSTGMWTGWYSGTWPDGYLIYADCCTNPKGSFWKPLADLTEDERRHMDECEKIAAGHSDRILSSFASMDPTP